MKKENLSLILGFGVVVVVVVFLYGSITIGKAIGIIPKDFLVQKQEILVTPSATEEVQKNATRDVDNDGLIDIVEAKIGTDPLDPDSDCDGYSDGEEIRSSNNPLMPAAKPNQNPSELVKGAHELNACQPHQVTPGTKGGSTTDQSKASATVDTDGDGLPDSIESLLKTDAKNADTDGDGISDTKEVLNGTDPTVANK
jgi:hypothetical protein